MGQAYAGEIARPRVSSEAIARELWISRHTLRDHVKAVYAKCRVNSRSELTALLVCDHLSEGLADTGTIPPPVVDADRR